MHLQDALTLQDAPRQNTTSVAAGKPMCHVLGTNINLRHTMIIWNINIDSLSARPSLSFSRVTEPLWVGVEDGARVRESLWVGVEDGARVRESLWVGKS